MFHFDYPYSDRYTLNLDWIIKTVQGNNSTVQELQANIENVVRSIIAKEFEKLFVTAAYDEETETISMEVRRNG